MNLLFTYNNIYVYIFTKGVEILLAKMLEYRIP